MRDNSVTDGDKLLAEKLADPVQVVDGPVQPGGHVASPENTFRVDKAFEKEEEVVAGCLGRGSNEHLDG